jgi:hypothetical protein
MVMLRIRKESEEEASGARFRQILAEVRRARASLEEPGEEETDPSRFAAHPLANAIFSIDDRPPTPGGASPWDEALAWIEEYDEPTAVAQSQRPAAESAEAILDELGLSDKLTHDELNQARRLYMWRNHPDRLGEAQRESATRRVAIANMLIDRAQARLISVRRP